MANPRYVLISACRNEKNYIDALIDTVSNQTVKPMRWVIVDDGSVDETYERAKAKRNGLNFIRLVKRPLSQKRSFASRVYALQYGYDLIKGLNFEYIGFLDADIRFQENYYERLIEYFHFDKKLGLAGGLVVDKYDDRIVNIRSGSEDYHVAGGVQFFRRECFKQIGGKTPVHGGEDVISDIKSMMSGWKVESIPDIEVIHLRPKTFDNQGACQNGLAWGKKFYSLGYHPLYYFGQCLRRIGSQPIPLASFWRIFGFILATLKTEPRYVSADFVTFLRKLQIKRIKKMLRNQKSIMIIKVH